MKMKAVLNVCLMGATLVGAEAFAAEPTPPPVNTVTTRCLIPAQAESQTPPESQGFVCCGQPVPNDQPPKMVGWYPILNPQAPLICPPSNSSAPALIPLEHCVVTPGHNPISAVYAFNQSTNIWVEVPKTAPNYPTACSKESLAQTAPPAAPQP